jgi:dolichyl-phosphate beta-glucosyltransferase
MQTISVIIPAYNEEKRLGKTLSLWQEYIKKERHAFKISEIIIIDDGSKDKTIEVADSFKKYLPIKIIKISQNKGKGNAVKNGVKEAQGDLIFIYDADGAVAPEEIYKLFLGINEVDIVIGSRTAPGADAKISLKRRFVGMCFHFLCSPLLPGIKDASCGAKLFKKDAAKKVFRLQKIDRFAFDIEILWLAKKLNYKVKEIGIRWQEVSGSKVSIFKDGLEMFFSVLGLYKRQLLDKITK